MSPQLKKKRYSPKTETGSLPDGNIKVKKVIGDKAWVLGQCPQMKW